MITTIKDYKIMLESTGHMGFTPELSTSTTNTTNTTRDRVADTLNCTLEWSQCILNYVKNGQHDFEAFDEEIMDIASYYYHPYYELVEEKLEAIRQNNGIITLLDIEWFTDIDNEDLMDHNEYTQFEQDIDSNIQSIKRYLQQ